MYWTPLYANIDKKDMSPLQTIEGFKSDGQLFQLLHINGPGNGQGHKCSCIK